MPLAKDLVSVRDAVTDDLNFILNSWLRSYRNTYMVRFVANDVYFQSQKRLITRLLGSRKIVVVHPKDEYNQIIGYLVHGVYSTDPASLVIDYAYVKSSYRRMGFFNNMVAVARLNYKDGAEVICPIVTQMSLKLQPKFGWSFNPYIYIR